MIINNWLLAALKKGFRPGYQGGVYPRLWLVVVVVVVPLYVYPRNPPMRPRMRPMKFIDSIEKTSTSPLFVKRYPESVFTLFRWPVFAIIFPSTSDLLNLLLRVPSTPPIERELIN